MTETHKNGTSDLPRRAVGDMVRVVFDGELIACDPDAGTVTLRGNTLGAKHIPWDMAFHWATNLYEEDDVEVDPRRINARMMLSAMRDLDEIRDNTRVATLYDVAILIDDEDPAMAERLRALARSFEVPRTSECPDCGPYFGPPTPCQRPHSWSTTTEGGS